ncbi:putative chalcone isomerase [Helianthus debilis subsp. tardiflorus]
MAKPNSTTSLQVESIIFPPSAKPPGATNTLFLGGAGVRGLDIDGNFVKFSGIGVYLEYKAISSLAVKWKGKSVEELTDSVEFYRDIVTGKPETPFFINVNLIKKTPTLRNGTDTKNKLHNYKVKKTLLMVFYSLNLYII